MMGAGALALLWAASLLISSGNCGICPAVKKDVYIFLTGSPDEYVAQVKKYQNDSLILANARKLKNCIDQKLTEEDKENAISVLVAPSDDGDMPLLQLHVSTGQEDTID
ncbi:major allergen I polypeptide chain 1 isoform X1 [Pipistrellus kuhlii]|uniref:major allergen I polypeptide chain 1 isoform X1 n=1 Tax=Pipistrellus kuhlii TaxID=59472 RepID=UPI00174F549D|nr:major allergen I polypeptide chain 1 isoform X1 [Pipistrellus kuhlii]